MSEALSHGRTPGKSELTRAAEARHSSEGVREFLGFRLSTEAYALPLGSIREILKPPPLTEVPRARADILGIISVRGRITTVFDLRRKLQMPPSDSERHARILLVDDGEEIIGLLVDRVLQVYRLSEEEVELASTLGGEMSEHVLGIGRPRAGRTNARARGEEGSELASEEILILLDPGPLLRR